MGCKVSSVVQSPRLEVHQLVSVIILPGSKPKIPPHQPPKEPSLSLRLDGRTNRLAPSLSTPQPPEIPFPISTIKSLPSQKCKPKFHSVLPSGRVISDESIKKASYDTQFLNGPLTPSHGQAKARRLQGARSHSNYSEQSEIRSAPKVKGQVKADSVHTRNQDKKGRLTSMHGRSVSFFTKDQLVDLKSRMRVGHLPTRKFPMADSEAYPTGELGLIGQGSGVSKANSVKSPTKPQVKGANILDHLSVCGKSEFDSESVFGNTPRAFAKPSVFSKFQNFDNNCQDSCFDSHGEEVADEEEYRAIENKSNQKSNKSKEPPLKQFHLHARFPTTNFGSHVESMQRLQSRNEGQSHSIRTKAVTGDDEGPSRSLKENHASQGSDLNFLFSPHKMNQRRIFTNKNSLFKMAAEVKAPSGMYPIVISKAQEITDKADDRSAGSAKCRPFIRPSHHEQSNQVLTPQRRDEHPVIQVKAFHSANKIENVSSRRFKSQTCLRRTEPHVTVLHHLRQEIDRLPFKREDLKQKPLQRELRRLVENEKASHFEISTDLLKEDRQI